MLSYLNKVTTKIKKKKKKKKKKKRRRRRKKYQQLNISDRNHPATI